MFSSKSIDANFVAHSSLYASKFRVEKTFILLLESFHMYGTFIITCNKEITSYKLINLYY